MNLIDKINKQFGMLYIEIEGFFTERFLNICKFNRIKVWEVQNIVSGKVRFNMYAKDFKKLKSVAKKTKCKVKIKNKKGIYFVLFKYRKRKIIIFLLVFLIMIFIASNQFIWNIKINGNNYYKNDYILDNLINMGIKKGTLKNKIDTNLLSKNLRSKLISTSFISTELKGTTLIINIKEKTVIEEENNKIGDICSDKSGIIKKIVVENGTAKYKLGSYIDENMVLIEGKIYSKYLEPKDVKAKGNIFIEREYVFEKKYNYDIISKKSLPTIRYNVGFSFNFKEFYVNYLNKDRKYDKIKYSKGFNLFGNNISFDLYKFNEYIEENKKLSLQEIKDIFNKESLDYINNIKNKSRNFKVIDEKVEIKNNDKNVNMKKRFIVYEEIGKFVER